MADACGDQDKIHTSEETDGHVDFINEYSERLHKGVLRCQILEGKGRTLSSARNYRQGEVILLEQPLHIGQESPESPAFRQLKELVDNGDFDYEALWYWCSLLSLTADEMGEAANAWESMSEEKQSMLLMLHQGDIDGAVCDACCKIVEEFHLAISPQKLERIVQVWIHNTFDYSDEPVGYATYFVPSFMSHSCFPNVFWHYGDNDVYVLRCRQDIHVGDEVTVSYLDETLMLGHAVQRRWDLWESKQFWCTCNRCINGTDFSRGLSCPSCASGSVFASLPALEQSDDSLEADLWVGARCTQCGHTLNDDEAEQLNQLELQLHELVEDWQERPLKDRDLRQARQLIEQSFKQHALADKALEDLSKFCRSFLRYSELLEFYELRMQFAEAAYPGLSAASAWLMESFADTLRALAKKEPDTASARLRQALGLYEKSLSILLKLFGEVHQYTRQLIKKYDGVSACFE